MLVAAEAVSNAAASAAADDDDLDGNPIGVMSR